MTVKEAEKSKGSRVWFLYILSKKITGAVQVYKPICPTHLCPSKFVAHCLSGFRTLLHGSYEFGPWIWRDLGSNSTL